MFGCGNHAVTDRATIGLSKTHFSVKNGSLSYRSKAISECTRHLRGFPPKGDACAILSSVDRKKANLRIFTLNFSKPSRTTWVQILRIIRKHEHETVNIFSNKSYRQFFSYYKKRQNSTFLAFAKILSIGFLSKNCNI